ncbi:MAG: LacI family DNA-binding transcriptional regulator [Pseudomonadota bacterium]
MGRKRRSAKIEDVAARANVSIMSVSRAIRGVDGVSEKKRTEILRIAREMKYVPNSNARSLAVANSNLIGISLPTFAGEVFADILNGMRRTFDSAGYSSVIDTTEYSPEAELNWVRRLLSWQPAGIILTGLDHQSETRELLRASPIPVLEIWDHTDNPIDICVGIDHYRAGQMIGEHAVALGYTRPAFVTAPRGYDMRADARLAGLRDVFSREKATDVLSARPEASNSFATGFDGTAMLLDAGAPDIICYLNDHMAFGGLMCCQARGVSVPRDMGIIGFNQLDLASVLPRKLTTVRTLRRLMGITGATHLLARINGVPTEKSKPLPLELIPGETTRPQG